MKLKKKIRKDTVFLFKAKFKKFCCANPARELEGLLEDPHDPYSQRHFINPQRSLPRKDSAWAGREFPRNDH